MDTTRDFTSGPIVGPLIRFSLPILAALFLQALYGAVDLLVVGKYAATADVSGVAVGSQIMMTVTGLISSLAMGSTILLGQKLGMRAEKDCGSVIGVSIAFFGLVGLALTLLLPLLSAVLARLMNAPEEAFRETRQYIAICGGGSLAIVEYNVLGSVMRGLGDSRTPLMTVAIACAVNIAGDLLLVAVFHLGAAGAAIATVAAQLISVLVSFLVLRRRGLPFPFSRRDVRFDGRALRTMLRFGVPIALQDVLVSLSFLVILSIANSLGLAASAGKDDRAIRGLRIAIALSTAFGLVMFYLAFFHGDLLCGIFARDESVILAGADYLKAYAIDCLFTCFLFCFIGFYNGLGYTGFVSVQGVAAAFLVRIPVAILMRRVLGTLFGIGLGVPVATACQILACFVFLRHLSKKKLLKQHTD
ncbi:MAG: MATE family efflux transporter [Oscillospiraceae bacterium]|nr:MATE family efflux transporter [Oscillospiraceae bacterium]